MEGRAWHESVAEIVKTLRIPLAVLLLALAYHFIGGPGVMEIADVLKSLGDGS